MPPCILVGISWPFDMIILWNIRKSKRVYKSCLFFLKHLRTFNNCLWSVKNENLERNIEGYSESTWTGTNSHYCTKTIRILEWNLLHRQSNNQSSEYRLRGYLFETDEYSFQSRIIFWCPVLINIDEVEVESLICTADGKELLWLSSRDRFETAINGK